MDTELTCRSSNLLVFAYYLATVGFEYSSIVTSSEWVGVGIGIRVVRYLVGSENRSTLFT